MVSGHKIKQKMYQNKSLSTLKNYGPTWGVAGQWPLSNSSKGLLKLFTKRAFLFVPLPKARRVNENLKPEG